MDIKLENIEAVFLAHDRHEVTRYSKAADVLSALLELQRELHNICKYCDPNTQFKDQQAAIEWCKATFYECLEDYAINLDDF